MFLMLLYAFALTAATVVIHGLGSFEAMAFLRRMSQRSKGQTSSVRAELLMLRVVGVLLLLHWLEAAIWALFFLVSEVLPDFETAFYYSLTSYTTLGYGDVVLPREWRLLGPTEGAFGILMFGWSTGIIVAVITRIYQIRQGLNKE